MFYDVLGDSYRLLNLEWEVVNGKEERQTQQEAAEEAAEETNKERRS